MKYFKREKRNVEVGLFFIFKYQKVVKNMNNMKIMRKQRKLLIELRKNTYLANSLKLQKLSTQKKIMEENFQVKFNLFMGELLI